MRKHTLTFSEEEMNKPLPPSKDMDELMHVFETHTPDELVKIITSNLAKELDKMEIIRDEKDVRVKIAQFMHHVSPSTGEAERMIIETFVKLGDKNE